MRVGLGTEYGRVRHDLTWDSVLGHKGLARPVESLPRASPTRLTGRRGARRPLALDETSKGRKRETGPTAGGEDGHWTRKDWESVNGGRDTVDRDTRWLGHCHRGLDPSSFGSTLVLKFQDRPLPLLYYSWWSRAQHGLCGRRWCLRWRIQLCWSSSRELVMCLCSVGRSCSGGLHI